MQIWGPLCQTFDSCELGSSVLPVEEAHLGDLYLNDQHGHFSSFQGVLIRGHERGVYLGK